ncbi:hypothetical protein [Paenibacillus sp. GP183]|jgi:hypothetical protein|uniref:hypothetical protein n=1 Tax=Paenibacillus sp. GP183 TaxID=1882751 RepID=UPI0008987272|nr:hypothetical protein [Paenibacillus sp. GP183]SEB72227.1 hypothetical protein SAMN05443246_1691 [Paenibacillus sp. GP183]
MIFSFDHSEWLDEYNDYMMLYKMFGDEEYLEEAVEVLNSLKALVTRTEYYHKFMVSINDNEIQKFK